MSSGSPPPAKGSPEPETGLPGAGGDVRERILDEATRLFVSSGYHGLSMREIAEAAGVSKAGLYYHFLDKEALFLAILSDHLDRIAAILQDARLAGDTRAQVERMMHAIFRRAPEQRALIRLASQEMHHLSTAGRAQFSQLYHDKFIGQVETLLREGMERGELQQMDARLATWLLLGMMYPFFYPAHAAALDSPEKAAELMVSIFFEGAGRR